MSFMGNLFKKKDEFDSDNFGMDENSNNYSTGSDDPFNSSSNLSGDDPFANQPDPFAEKKPYEDEFPTSRNTTPVDDPFNVDLPKQQFGSPKSEQPTLDSIPNSELHSQTPGQQLAHNYMNPPKEQVKPHDPLELINLKLDTIKSSLENLDLRMRKLESLIEKNGKTW